MGLLTPVLLICRGVLLVHALPDNASTNISFAAGVSSVCGVSLLVEILRFVRRGTTETSPMVRQLNNFWANLSLLVWVTVYGPLLVWVTVSGLLVISTCVSLTFVMFNSYPASFIFKLLIASTSSSDISSFSLVKIVLGFSLYELDTWLNTSVVMLVAPDIDSFSCSLMTFNIAYWIFTLDNGDLLLSLKVVMVLLGSV